MGASKSEKSKYYFQIIGKGASDTYKYLERLVSGRRPSSLEAAVSLPSLLSDMGPTCTDRDASGLLAEDVDGSQDNKRRVKGDAPIASLLAGRKFAANTRRGPPISRGNEGSSIGGIIR